MVCADAATLMAMIWGFRANGIWKDERGVNLLDTGAHMYDTYACADGKFISVGSIEPQFYTLLRQHAGVADDPDFDAQHDKTRWPALKAKLAAIFATRTRDEWDAMMSGSDVCFAPVLSMHEATQHPHNIARGTFAEIGAAIQPMPAPRYSATPTATPVAAPATGSDSEAILAELGFTSDAIAAALVVRR